ncbi:hypothetical protein OPV22_013208 [Ensete ventricosum]|uniref:Uncharacterized protein n=1 Tax=Ensete ventricosum TaxID=4639 RepID=A0AAV8R8R2_ENSVE|nr:hypothetical protein OPV22_013208 [Ensete ventricosum]
MIINRSRELFGHLGNVIVRLTIPPSFDSPRSVTCNDTATPSKLLSSSCRRQLSSRIKIRTDRLTNHVWVVTQNASAFSRAESESDPSSPRIRSGSSLSARVHRFRLFITRPRHLMSLSPSIESDHNITRRDEQNAAQPPAESISSFSSSSSPISYTLPPPLPSKSTQIKRRDRSAVPT